MLYPPIDELRTKADNKYTLVSLAAKRARDIIDGYPVLIDEVKVNKPVSIATEEIAEDQISYSRSEALEIMKRTGIYPKKETEEMDDFQNADEVTKLQDENVLGPDSDLDSVENLDILDNSSDSEVEMTITFASEDGEEKEESFSVEFESEELSGEIVDAEL